LFGIEPLTFRYTPFLTNIVASGIDLIWRWLLYRLYGYGGRTRIFLTASIWHWSVLSCNLLPVELATSVGDTVEFTAGPANEGGTDSTATDIAPRAGTPPRSLRRSHRGVVEAWLTRFGSIKADDGDYFFHIKDTVRNRFDVPPPEGSEVEFDLIPDPNSKEGRMKATRVVMRDLHRGGDNAPSPARTVSPESEKGSEAERVQQEEIEKELRKLRQERKAAEDRENALKQELREQAKEVEYLRPPLHWENQAGQEASVVPVVGKLVRTEFERMLKGRRVLHCWRLEHHQRWKEYAMKRDTVQKEIGSAKAPDPGVALAGVLPDPPLDRSVNEAWLLHGTSLESIVGIKEHGFNERYCKRAKYGEGIYFAEDIEKSINPRYAKPTTLRNLAKCPEAAWSVDERLDKLMQQGAGRDIQFVVVARCTLGWFVRAGKPSTDKQDDGVTPLWAPGAQHRQLALNPGLPPYHFHALDAPRRRGCGGREVPRELVIYDGKQAYPAYILCVEKISNNDH